MRGEFFRRIHPEKRRTALEYVFVIVLSIATLASAWCGYQLQQWNGAATDARAEADDAMRQAGEHVILAMQTRTMDGLAVLEYWRMLRDHDVENVDRMLARLRPVLREAIEASIADGVLVDPTKPGPLQHPKYVLPDEVEAGRLRELASQRRQASADAGRTSNSYVVVTLMFATVLFFGGIAGTFTQPRVRTIMAFISICITMTTLVMLVRLPTILN